MDKFNAAMDKFDERLELWRKNGTPDDMHGALVDVNDTLDLCMTMAEVRFKDTEWTAADVIALVRLTLEREAHLRAAREAKEWRDSEED